MSEKQILDEIHHRMKKYTVYSWNQLGIEISVFDKYRQTEEIFSNEVLKMLTELYLKYSMEQFEIQLKQLIRSHILVIDLDNKSKRRVVDYVKHNFVSIDKLHETISAAVKSLENRSSILKIKNTVTMILNDVNKKYAEMREDHFKLLENVRDDLETM